MGAKVRRVTSVLLALVVETVSSAGQLAFRSYPWHVSSSFLGPRSQERAHYLSPGLSQARVRAAAAEWLLLHACEMPLYYLQLEGATCPTWCWSGGAEALESRTSPCSESRAENNHVFLGLQCSILNSPTGEHRVHARGMTDLPPEASIMQLYEYTAATDASRRELHACRAACARHDDVDSHNREINAPGSGCVHVRSGTRGGVEAIRGGDLRLHESPAPASSSSFTSIHRNAYVPLLVKGYCRGDASWLAVDEGRMQQSVDKILNQWWRFFAGKKSGEAADWSQLR